MLKDDQSLRRRTNPLPDESLLSLLVRLTALNSYEALSLLKGLIFENPNSLKPFRDSLEFPLKPSTYKRLSSLTQLDISSLYLCTLHRFAPILTPLSQSIVHDQLPNNISIPIFYQGRSPKQLRPQHAAQFCPNCLKEKAHYTLKWAPVAASICLQHECLLVDRCHECHQEVSSIAIARARCDDCQADLSMAKTISVCNDELGLWTQRIIQSWLIEFSTPVSTIALLPQKPPRVLYWLVEDLQLFIRTLRNDSWTYIHRLEKGEELFPVHKTHLSEDMQLLSPYESYRLYTTACKSIGNWPESFFDFLHHYRNRNVESSYSRYQGPHLEQKGKLIPGILAASLGDLYTQWLPQRWKSEEYEFLRAVLNSYIAYTYWFSDISELKSFCKKNPELAEHCMYASIADAAHLLEIPTEIAEFLIGNDQVHCKNTGNDTTKLVTREKVFSLKDAQGRSLPLQGVVVRLGLPMNIIKDLIKAGMFSEGESKTKDFSLEEVTSIGEILFLRKITHYTRELLQAKIDNKGSYVNLTDADRLLSVASLNIVTIFLQVVSGKLWAYTPNEQLSRLESLLFSCADIQMLATKYETQRLFLLEQKKVAKALGVKEEVLGSWTRKGIITPEAMYGTDLYFAPAIIDDFMRKYIFGEDAIKVLGLDLDLIDSIWANPAFLSQICIKGFDMSRGNRCIFDREELIQWRSERLTFDEAVKKLKVSETALYKWIDTGKILYTDFLNEKPTWLLLQEILNLEKDAGLYQYENSNEDEIAG